MFMGVHYGGIINTTFYFMAKGNQEIMEIPCKTHNALVHLGNKCILIVNILENRCAQFFMCCFSRVIMYSLF